MQDALFPDEIAPPVLTSKPRGRVTGVQPLAVSDEIAAIGAALPSHVRLGTSSWSYPGWAGQVWDKAYSEQTLAKQGLTAYAKHPLLRAVCIDRSFYRALTAAQFERYAAQVPEDFRFTVKAPSVVTDALVRDEEGRGRQPNPAFLNPELAVSEFIQPALEGLGDKIGALVFQLSPLPVAMRERMPVVLERLEAMLQALPAIPGVVAVEVRDPEFLVPEFAEILRGAGATYCLGLHAKMPQLAEQLPLLRALWPGPLVCRWNLHPRHGPYGHQAANERYAPFDRLVDADPETHAGLARVIRATAAAGHKAMVTISNEAEGCAPQSILSLAREIVSQQGSQG